MVEVLGVLPDTDSGKIVVFKQEDHLVVDDRPFQQEPDPALRRPALTSHSSCDVCGSGMLPSGNVWSCPNCGDMNRRRNN